MSSIISQNQQVAVVNDQALQIEADNPKSGVAKAHFREEQTNQAGVSSEGYKRYPKNLYDGAPDNKQKPIPAENSSAIDANALQYKLTPALENKLQHTAKPAPTPTASATPRMTRS